jgi:subtilisin family serine protease
VLHARLAATVTAEGLSPWSRDFARQAQSDPRLRERLARPARVEAVNGAFAGFTREVDPRSLETALFKPYRWVRLVWPNDSDGASIKERLRQTGLFEHVELTPPIRFRRLMMHQSATINDPLYAVQNADPHRWQWAIPQVKFDEAFSYTEGRVLIGVPDNGINPNHPDLQTAQRPHQRAAFVSYMLSTAGLDETFGGNFDRGFFPHERLLNGDLGGNQPPLAAIARSYYVGHGIHVAGLIAATKNNAEGGVGGCPGCGLAPIRVWDPDLMPEVWNALGLSFGASAINMSFGLPYLSQLHFDTLAALDARDVSLVASIGNTGTRRRPDDQFSADRSSPYPAGLPFVVGVGGVDVSGERWYERTIANRSDLQLRHPQIKWDAIFEEIGCTLGVDSDLDPNLLLPVRGPRTECGSSYGRAQRSFPFVVTYSLPGNVSYQVNLPPGEYGLDLMAPAAQVLAPLDRIYTTQSDIAFPVPLGFPCWFTTPSPPANPACLGGVGRQNAPGTHLIANAGVAMGPDDPLVTFTSFSQMPRNEPGLGHADYGTITGTSMAAPLVTAAVGLVRSVNPLLRAAAVHDLLRCTAEPMTGSQVWSGEPPNAPPTITPIMATQLTGAGRLDAKAAVMRTLGTVGGQTLRNRLIPMLSLATWPEAPRQSWLFTSSPQVAMNGVTGDLHRLQDPALTAPNLDDNFPPEPSFPQFTTGNPLPSAAPASPPPPPEQSSPLNDVGATQGIAYVSAIVAGVGAVLPSTTYAFPGNWPKAEILNASASFFVFSVPFNPLTQAPNGLVALHRMSMKCSQFRHHFYTTDESERNAAINAQGTCTSVPPPGVQGWYDEGIDGYIYDPNLPAPPGTVELRRGWLASIGNWVLMTAEEHVLGKFPGVSNVIPLGYVYPAVKYTANGAQFLDDDLDTLPDAFELLIGTNVKNADSDGDGRPDGEEFPFAALPVSDPLVADGANPCVPR